VSLPRGLLVSAAAILLLAGCAANGADRGRIPIPVPPRDPTPVTAEAGHPQLVVTGDQVRVVLSPEPPFSPTPTARM